MAATSNGSRLIQVGVAAVVILATTVTLLGIQGKVQSLQAQVDELRDQQVLIDENAARIESLQEQVGQVARFRDDIVLAICIANARTARDIQRCRDARGEPSNLPGPTSYFGRNESR